MEKFWMVKRIDNPDKMEHPSNKIHYTYQKAYDEAIRLSRLFVGSKFCILEFTGTYAYSTIETVVENASGEWNVQN